MSTCKECRFWRQPSGLPWKQGEHPGTCRRYPPQVVTMIEMATIKAVSDWPRTYHFDWCGEHCTPEAASE